MAQHRASSAPPVNRRLASDGADIVEAEHKLQDSQHFIHIAFRFVTGGTSQAAVKDAEELKQLIAEADAETDALHQQLKSMGHGCLGIKNSPLKRNR